MTMYFEIVIEGKKQVARSRKGLFTLLEEAAVMPKGHEEAFVDGVIFGLQQQDDKKDLFRVNGKGIKSLWDNTRVFIAAFPKEAVFGDSVGDSEAKTKIKLAQMKKDDSKGFREKMKKAVQIVKKDVDAIKRLTEKGVLLDEVYAAFS